MARGTARRKLQQALKRNLGPPSDSPILQATLVDYDLSVGVATIELPGGGQVDAAYLQDVLPGGGWELIEEDSAEDLTVGTTGSVSDDVTILTPGAYDRYNELHLLVDSVSDGGEMFVGFPDYMTGASDWRWGFIGLAMDGTVASSAYNNSGVWHVGAPGGQNSLMSVTISLGALNDRVEASGSITNEGGSASTHRTYLFNGSFNNPVTDLESVQFTISDDGGPWDFAHWRLMGRRRPVGPGAQLMVARGGTFPYTVIGVLGGQTT